MTDTTTQQSTYESRLKAAALALDVDVDEVQRQALLQYITQLQRWNRAYNLTAVRDPEHMLVQHVFDSLSIVAPIRALLGMRAAAAVKVLDVGSGAGLPGVVLAVVFPHWQVHCVDAVEKKVAFIRQAASVLRLGNLHAVHARIETVPAMQADVVISRAFASLLDFVRLAGQHVAPHGHLLAMKGRDPDQEIEEVEEQTNWCVDNIQTLSVPELNAQRCLVSLSHQGNP